MSIKYDQLAIELDAKLGDLTTLGEKIGISFSAREPLTSEDADKLRKAFRGQPKELTTPQLLSSAPIIRNATDIQQTDSSSVSTQEDPTGSDLEIAYNNLRDAQDAQDTQSQEVFESGIRSLKHQNVRLGVMKRVFAETAEIEGFMAADNAITESKQMGSAAAFKRQTAMLAGKEGADFLPNSYPNAAESSTKIPEPPQSIAQQTLDILDRLKKS